MDRRSCSVILKGILRTISRLARLGAGPVGAFDGVEVEDLGSISAINVFLDIFEGLTMAGFARPSRRFLRVTERRAPLNTCA